MDLTPLAGYASVVEIDVAWGEMDAFRHVNNAVYFRYFETARIRYLADVGWDVYEPAVLPILGTVEARFVRPVVFPDRLAVGTRPTELHPKRLVLEHAVLSRTRGEIVTRGKSVVVAVSEEHGTVAVPDGVAAAVGKQLPARPGG